MNGAQLKIDLIENTYKSSEAKKVITQLINDKIKFLKVQIFRNEERTGGKSPQLEQRLVELKKSKKELEGFFESLKNDEESKIEIHCPIQINVVKQLVSKNKTI